MNSSVINSPPATPPADLLTGVFESLEDAVFIMDRTFGRNGLGILHANAAAARITGYTLAELEELPHGRLHLEREDVRTARRWFKRQPDTPPLTAEGYLRRRDGTTVNAAWTLSPLRDANGEVTHIVAIYRDVSEQRRLREALAHSQRLEAVSRLAGGVAHDFNNLISVIRGYCEILTDTVADNAKARQEVKEIYEAGQRASELVGQLLAFSRRQALAPQVINPNRFIEENRAILGHLLGPDALLIIDPDPSVHNIQADPAQLRQVLLNLVLNARDAIKANGTVTLTTASRDITPGRNRRSTDLTPGRYVVISVADDGCGMDESTQGAMFEPYFTTKPDGQGTGLGLALVHGVVQQSGGRVDVQTAAGLGTKFELLFPEVLVPADALTGSLAPLPPPAGDESVLLLESDSVVRRMVEGTLRSAGYQVTAAGSATKARELLSNRTDEVHLVIVDYSGRGNANESLLRELHARQPGLSVVCLPNAGTDLLPWLDTSRQIVLPKPISLNALLRATRDLLDDRN